MASIYSTSYIPVKTNKRYRRVMSQKSVIQVSEVYGSHLYVLKRGWIVVPDISQWLKQVILQLLIQSRILQLLIKSRILQLLIKPRTVPKTHPSLSRPGSAHTLKNIGSLEGTLQYYYHETPGEPLQGSPGVAC